MQQSVSKALFEQINSATMPSYVYGYPLKRAYHKLSPACDLEREWGRQNGPVNVYIHLPFCAYRCNFCTLLATPRHDPVLRSLYLKTLNAQIDVCSQMAGHLKLQSIYFGGGTPALLETSQLSGVLNRILRSFAGVSSTCEISIEGAPDSLTPAKIRELRESGFNRVSMGLQTLHPAELRTTGRPYSVDCALLSMRAVSKGGFKNFSFDLIYGLAHQDCKTWIQSLEQALDFKPPSLSLYPVVIRAGTAISRVRQREPQCFKDSAGLYKLYDHAVSLLASHGYRQESFTRFTLLDSSAYLQESLDFQGVPVIGLGAGARSYTPELHYGSEYAVGECSVSEVIGQYLKGSPAQYLVATHGINLDKDEQRRRFVILNLSLSRLNRNAYRSIFGSWPEEDFPGEFSALRANDIVFDCGSDTLGLTAKGFKYSNIASQIFFSPRMQMVETLSRAA